MYDQKIAILVNPLAGKGRARAIGGMLVGRLYHFAINYTFFDEDWPDHFDGFTQVWLAGGDGTVNYFINRYPDLDLPLALFKGGTGDDFACQLYGNADWKQQLDIVLKAQPKPVDAGVCNGKLFLVGVGIGFEGEILKSMSAIRSIGGHLGYYLIVLKKIFGFKEQHFTITGDKLISNEKLLLVEVNNASRTGGGFIVSPEALINDGLLNLVTCKPLSVISRLRYLPVIEKGRHLSLPIIHHVKDKHFVVECKKTLPAHIDGEFMEANKFEFTVLPGKFRFLY